MALVCPNCGVATAFSPVFEVLRGQLASTIGRTDHIEYTELVVPLRGNYHYDEDDFAICMCQACGEKFVAVNERYLPEGDWQPVYPLSHKTVSQEVPEHIRSKFEEACLCFAIGAYRACVAMCQATLETLWWEKQASSLNELYEKGILSSQLRSQADEVRLWANIVKHVPVIDAVSKEDTEQLVGYLDAILHAVYVEPAKFDALRQKRKQLDNK